MRKTIWLGQEEKKAFDHALLEAAATGDEAGVLRALKAGANPQAIGRWQEEGWTALACAARGREGEGADWSARARMCQALIHFGAAADKRGAAEWTALHHAAFGGASAEVINLLLAAGSPLEARMSAGQTALSLAAESGAEETILALLLAGADLSSRDDRGKSPRDWARGEKGNALSAALARAEAVELRGALAPDKPEEPRAAVKRAL